MLTKVDKLCSKISIFSRKMTLLKRETEEQLANQFSKIHTEFNSLEDKCKKNSNSENNNIESNHITVSTPDLNCILYLWLFPMHILKFNSLFKNLWMKLYKRYNHNIARTSLKMASLLAKSQVKEDPEGEKLEVVYEREKET